MKEPEFRFPVTCPICSQQILSGFRISIIADAFHTGDIRLYSSCHLASWDASTSELEQMRKFLDATWSTSLTHSGAEEYTLAGGLLA